MTLEEKRNLFYKKYNTGNFSISRIIKPNIYLVINGNKINCLTEEEKAIIMDNDVILSTINLDNNAINNLNINDVKKYLIKSKNIKIYIDWKCLEENENILKINELDNYNKNISLEIKEDYLMKNRDYNLLNKVKLKTIIPIRYAMWMDLRNITNPNILFSNKINDYYTLYEMKSIKNQVLMIIDEIYSDYENLDDYEKFWLALQYINRKNKKGEPNWMYESKGKDKDNLDYYNDEFGHKYNSSLFRILETRKSVCAGFCSLFQLILNNPIVNVNVNLSSGKYTPYNEGHVWLNTLINNKVYEQCLTIGRDNIFSKLNENYYIYSDSPKFEIQKSLGLPLKYDEIPNAKEKLAKSVELKKKNVFTPIHEWGDYSWIIDAISNMNCDNKIKQYIEEYIYRAIKLQFITNNNINGILNNFISFFNKNSNIKFVLSNNDKMYETLTNIATNSNIDEIKNDYLSNKVKIRIKQIDGIETGWKNIDDIIKKYINYSLIKYPEQINFSDVPEMEIFILKQFGIPLKDCGSIEDTSKDTIIKDLMKKRFDNNYEKSIIEEYSVNNTNFPNMHEDFYDMVNTIGKYLSSKDTSIKEKYKQKLKLFTFKYRDFRLKKNNNDYIDLPNKRVKL